jgi:peptidoglycan/LPS O-acetylase OafA/YrhL
VVILQRISTEIRADLQVLRGVSVLFVVLFHIKPQSFPNGYLGVDIFFVISGYVLAPKILDIFTNGNSELLIGVKGFLKSRYRRLMPALVFMIIVISPLIFLLGPIEDHFKFFMQSCAAILGFANFSAVSLSGNYFNPHPNPILHTWSLSAEEQMYLLVPFCLFLIAKRTFLTIRKIQLFLFFVILASLAFYLEIPVWVSGAIDGIIPLYSEFIYYSPFSRLWQFAAGIALFTLISGKKISKSKFKQIIGNSLWIILIALLSSGVAIRDRFEGLIVVVVVLLIILFGNNSNYSIFLFFPFSWLGDRSYSIYLFHFPLIYLARFSPIFGDQSQSKKVYLIYALTLTFILSEISYRFVERILQKGRLSPSNPNSKHKAFGVNLVVFTFVASLVLAFSSNNNYWGINSNILRPAVAWELNPECPPMLKRNSPCFYGPKQNPKTLLIGDSQAAQLSQVYIDSSKEMGFNPGVWTLATCEFTLTSRKFSGQDPVCLEHNKRVFSWIVLTKPDLVLVAQHIKPESDHQNLANSVLKLSQVGVRTVLIENIPIFPDENLYMKNTTQLQLILGRSYIPPKSLPRSEMLLGFASASDAVSKIIKSNGIETIKLTDIFCDSRECSRFGSGRWLYWDNHHLSVYGAEMIRKRFLKTFESIKLSLD